MRLLKATMVLLQLQLNIPLRESHICTVLHGTTIGSTVSVLLFTPSMNMSPGETTLNKHEKANYQELVESCRSTKASWFQRDAGEDRGWFWVDVDQKRGSMV